MRKERALTTPPCHWNAACRGSALVSVEEHGEERLVGFLSWEDARHCVLFDIDDRILEAGTPSSVGASPSEPTEDELRAMVAHLERARPGWIYTSGDPAGYWIRVCEREHCGCELIEGPVEQRRRGGWAAL